MKKNRAILCVLLALIMAATAIVITNAKTSYELSDGAVIFNSNNTVSYLANGGSVNNLAISYDSAENAARLQVTGNASDPFALLNYASAGITSLSANEYKYVVVTAKVPTSASASATTTEIFWAAGSVSGPTGGCSKLFNFTKDGTYHSYVVDLSTEAGWTGTIHSLRVDPFTTASAGDTYYLDSVVLAKNTSEASTISAYRTAKANGTISDSQVQVIFTNENYDTYLTTDQIEVDLNGDIDRDRVISAKDVGILKKLLTCWTFDNINESAADVNHDGRITAKDLICLKKAVAGAYDLGNPASSATATISYDTTNNKAVLTAATAEPYVNFTYPANGEAMHAGQYRYAVITYMASKNGTASIYGITSNTGFENAAAHTINVNGDGNFHSVTIDLSSDSGWTGTITGLRIEFFDSASSGDVMKLDSITLVEKSSEASSVSNYREAIANGLSFSDTYTLDIKGQTLGQINTSGTWQNVGSTGSDPFAASWPAAGYATGAQDSLIVFANYDNVIKIADCVDLSKYDSVTVTYGTDASFGNNANALNSKFGLFSTKTVYGSGNTENTAGLLVSIPVSAANHSASSWITQRTATASINSNYVGPLYMSFCMKTGDGAVVNSIVFHLKTAVAETVDTLNNSAGSTVYTVAGDGSTINANGVTYPNKLNYTNGVTVGTDDVGRTLRTDKTAATNGGIQGYDFTDKNVGMFYFLWLGAHGTDLYDIQARVNQHGAAALTNNTGNDPIWGPLGVHQFFSEPMYGYYFSSEEWVIRRHIEELTNADVDFIFFDVTNGVTYIDNAKKVMRIIHEFNEMGYDPPKVVFYCNNPGDANVSYTGGVKTPTYLWNQIYSQNYYPDTWFYYQGHPVIIGKRDDITALQNIAGNFFTYRLSQWPNEDSPDGSAYSVKNPYNYTFYKKDGGWSWMDFTDLPYANKNPAGTAYEAINISVAQHLGTTSFSDPGIYNYNNHPDGQFRFNRWMNHGRNWNGTDNIDSANNGQAYKYGYNYQRQWDKLHNDYNDSLPIALVTGWNEWAAGRQPDANRAAVGMALFVDTATVNYSRDIEMTKGYYFDSYYMQTIDNIRQYKGAAPTLVRDQKKRIDVLGSFDQWNDVTTSYRDATSDQTARNTTGFSNTPYVNTTGRNDLKSCKIVYDTEYIYFFAECASNITPFSQSTPWMKILIDKDQSNSTGWYGYDYAVNYAAFGSNTTSVATLASNGTATITDRNVAYSVNGTMIMIKVPLSDLGISDYNNIDFAFKWVDSTTSITTMEQLYTYGDQMPHGRLNFVFTNH